MATASVASKIQHRVPRPVRCDECGSPHIGLQSRALMNLRMPSPGAWTLIWYCASCTAFVGCHEGTDLPFGLMGSYATRCARSALHAVFDELWRGPKRVMHREEAYHVLADILGRPIETAHISMMNATECDNARAIIEKRVKPQAVPRRKEDTRHWKHKKRKGG